MQDEPNGAVVSDAHARALASYWLDQHDADAPLTLFARTGAIGEETERSLERDLGALSFATAGGSGEPGVAQAQLGALLGYVRAHGLRDAVPGWDALPDEDPWSRQWVPAGGEMPADADHRNGRAVAPDHDDSLYERMGGGRRVSEVVEEFYRNMLDDPLLAHYFDGLDVQRVKAHQYAFLTVSSGGPRHYVGRPLARAHSGLGITPEHFDRALGHLAAAMKEVGVRDQEIDGLIEELRPYRAQVAAGE